MGAVGYTGGDPNKVDVVGDTMTGPLVLPADPVSDLQASTKAYVDAHAGGGGSTPSNTVVTEVSFGQAAVAGVSGLYSRGDHTHGTPPLSAVVALTDAATIATNAAQGRSFAVTLGGNRTLGNPTNPLDGQMVLWAIRQDGTGNRTLTLDTKFRLTSAVPNTTLSTAAGKTDYLGARYNLTDDKWDVLAFTKAV